MIIFKMILPRDYHTRSSTFGFVDQYYIKTYYDLMIVPNFGIQITADHPKFPPSIIKIIEYYPIGSQDAYIERLCFVDGKYLYPYRIKYITPDKKYDTQLVVPYALEQIHKIIDSRNCLDIITPGSLYIDHIRPGKRGDLPPNKKNIYEKYGSDLMLMSNLCPDNLQWYDVYDEIKRTDSFNNSVGRTMQNWYLDVFAEELLMPKVAFPDPLTVKTIIDPIKEQDLYYYGGVGSRTINMSQPKELEIKYPHMTKLSPKEQMTTVSFLSDVGYSDLELEYILSNRTINKRTIRFLHDRYHQKLNTDTELKICDRAVLSCFDSCRDVSSTEEYEDLMFQAVRVVFKKTFNDEAVFEFYNYQTDRPIRVIHLDLALLSLCSMGVITFNSM